ncbi:DUF3841 domain-containing protein [Streptomyces sp. NPDC048650]|uniref:DUF3841 domain-containing protein n=1 Tax=unclassified Streptomyces TaxID=2593676 RepID=UPI003710847B
MQLWTAQHRAVVEVLEETGRLVGEWDRVEPSLCPVYQVMVAEMLRRGIDCEGRPPVWAWAEPDTRDIRVLETARLLLSDNDFDRGAVVLDLDVPDEYVLRSSYASWNEVHFGFLSGERPPAMNWSIAPDEESDPDACRIQACLPMVHRSWVRGIRPIDPLWTFTG